MAGLDRQKGNKLQLGSARVMYMDVGVWGGPESGLPQMTFGLLEHNGIALCSYFASGAKVDLPVVPEINYDFHQTHMGRFLTLLMQKKYKVKLDPQDSRKGFHVVKIFPFEEKALLDDVNQLRVFVPDLHLHFYKGTYLDNFITYYGNECGAEGVQPVKLRARTSMEGEFAVFLETVTEFQKTVLPGSATSTHFMGDLCEFWETESITRYCRSKDTIDKFYQGLDGLGKWVEESLEKSPAAETDPRFRKLKGYVKELTRTKLADTPLDAETQGQLNGAYVSSQWQDMLFEPGDTTDETKRKAQALRKAILDKHHGRGGKSFSALFDELNWKHFIGGNHDNYLNGINVANDTFCFAPPELKQSLFQPQYQFANCALLYQHGHNMDFFNNDEACALGRVVTCLLAFYEMKQRGDLVRKFEGIFRTDEEVRLDYMKKIARLCYLWEKDDQACQKKNKVVILAHTHIPCLKDMTNETLIWKWAEGAWASGATQAQKVVRQF